MKQLCEVNLGIEGNEEVKDTEVLGVDGNDDVKDTHVEISPSVSRELTQSEIDQLFEEF